MTITSSNNPITDYHPSLEQALGYWDPRYWRTTCFTDTAATTPAQIGDPVRCIKNLGTGGSDWDLILNTGAGATPPTLVEIDGVPALNFATSQGLMTRVAVKPAAFPVSLVYAGTANGTLGRNMMGWLSTGSKLSVYLTRTTNGATQFNTSYVTTPVSVPLVQTNGPFYTTRENTRSVTIGTLDVGTQSSFSDDMNENQGMVTIYSPKANTWSSFASVETARFHINGTGGNGPAGGTTINVTTDQSLIFFGGLIKTGGALLNRKALAGYFMERMGC